MYLHLLLWQFDQSRFVVWLSVAQLSQIYLFFTIEAKLVSNELQQELIISAAFKKTSKYFCWMKELGLYADENEFTQGDNENQNQNILVHNNALISLKKYIPSIIIKVQK